MPTTFGGEPKKLSHPSLSYLFIFCMNGS
ncbi:hypothetical protein [Staphylococcus aureus]